MLRSQIPQTTRSCLVRMRDQAIWRWHDEWFPTTCLSACLVRAYPRIEYGPRAGLQRSGTERSARKMCCRTELPRHFPELFATAAVLLTLALGFAQEDALPCCSASGDALPTDIPSSAAFRQ